MTRILLVSIAVVAVLVDGYVFGVWTDRWGDTPAMERAVERLKRVPMEIGEWQGEPLELGAAQAAEAGFSGHWLRRYERREDGMAVKVMLACGRPGPLSVHTPTICYAGAGYTESQSITTYSAAAKGVPAEFYKGMFGKPDAAIPVRLRVYWTWRTDAGWKVSERPRIEFARQPIIYKLYVTHAMTGLDDAQTQEDAAVADFLEVLVPALEKTLASDP
jgi:hypothetical protein